MQNTDLYELAGKMATQNFLPYARHTVDASDVQSVISALQSESITRGPVVRQFERAIAEYTTAQYAVAFSSGSTALAAAYQAAKIGAADAVITSPNTFVATAAEAKKRGAAIHFSDIDSFGNCDFQHIKALLQQSRSRGRLCITPVHFAGVACDMASLSRQIASPDVVVIEDAAHALGSCYSDGARVGSSSFSDMTVFSFHPVKNITSAEGGMVTTNSESLYKRLQLIRNSGIEREKLAYKEAPEEFYYEVHELSCNYHMTELQAALGLSQLQRIDSFRQKKQAIVSLYRQRLASIPGLRLPPAGADERTHYHLFVVRIEFERLGLRRGDCMRKLAELGIGAQLHYVPMYNHPGLGARPADYKQRFPAMEAYFATALSIPLFTSMTEEDVDRVAKALRRVLLQSSFG